MSVFFKPYEGKRPYIFISYPHKQSDAVVETIRLLHDERYRLWYDEGIPAGSDWPVNIARHLQDCTAVIAFISEHFLKSQNCFSEIRAAVHLRKPILVVYLENVAPTGEWTALLEGCKTIPICGTAKERAQAILDASFLRRRLRRTWRERIPWGMFGLAASFLLFLASAAVLAALVSGYWSVPQQLEMPEQAVEQEREEPPAVVVDLGDAEKFFAIEFPDAQQERAIRDALGAGEEDILAGDLAEIKTLYFCGNMVLKHTDDITFDEDGSCRVNGARVVPGTVSDLDVIGKTVYLEELALVCQPVTDLTGLDRMALLRELDLAGSDIRSLDTLGELPSLEVLRLEHTAVKDLGPLEGLPRLKTVTVSRDMLPLSWSEDAGFDVVLVQ